MVSCHYRKEAEHLLLHTICIELFNLNPAEAHLGPVMFSHMVKVRHLLIKINKYQQGISLKPFSNPTINA